MFEGGDELLITSPTVRPTVYLVPTTTSQKSRSRVQIEEGSYFQRHRSDQSSVALAQERYLRGATYTPEVGDLDLDRRYTPKGLEIQGGFGSGSVGRWALTVGPDGGERLSACPR